MSEDTRAAFEAWAIAGNMSIGTLRHIAYDEGTYSDSRTHAAWLGWQASRAAALEEAAKVCDEEWHLLTRHECAEAIRSLASGG